MGNQSILTGTVDWSSKELRAAGEKILARPDGFSEELSQALLATEPSLLIIKPPVIIFTPGVVVDDGRLIKTEYPADPTLIALENLRSKMSEFDGREDMVECLLQVNGTINRRAVELYPELALANLDFLFVSKSGFIYGFGRHKTIKTTQI